MTASSGMPPVSAEGVPRARGGPLWWCALFALFMALLAPLTLTDVPPLLDYPNHLARLYVLAFAPTDPVLARFYQPHWAIIPNLALDMTVPPLLRLVPVHDAGRAVAGLIVLLPLLGCIAYQRALAGRMSLCPLGAVLFAYNGAVLRGFLNFTASVGLALMFAAVWLAWRENRPSLAIPVSAAGAIALFFCHLTGLLFFAILISGHEVAVLRTGPVSAGWLLRRLAVLAAVFAAPTLLYAASDLQGMRGAAEFRSVADKANAGMTSVMNYLWPLDLATAALCVAIPALCLTLRWCTIPSRAGIPAILLIFLFLALPTAFKGTFDLDTRFIVMAAFLIPAAVLPIALPRLAAWTICAGFLLLFSVRMGVLMSAWRAWDADVTRFRAVIASVRPGDVVLTVWRQGGSERHATARRLSDGTILDTHLPALLLVEHRAWWPFLFDNPSQQPIETREPYRTVAEQIDASKDPIGLLARDAPEMRLVTHVLVQGPAPDPAEIATGGLRLVAANEDTALYARESVSGLPPRSPPPDR